jgi:hypothetical protein
MDRLPIETIQIIAGYLGMKHFHQFQTLSQRYRSLDQVPYLDFARYTQLSEEEGFINTVAIYTPFRMQISNLDDKQFMFLALNLRATTACQWNRISQETKENVLDFFLISYQGYDIKDMAVALLKTGLLT